MALALGHEVTVFVRNPAAFTGGDRLHVVVGDALDPKAVAVGIVGQQAVLSALGGSLGRVAALGPVGLALLPVRLGRRALETVYVPGVQRLFEGRESGSALSNPDFQTYAKAFGVRSWRVTDAGGLRGALTEALAVNAPALIEVMTDITQEYVPWDFIAPGRG